MPKKAEDSLMRVERHLIHPSSPWFSMIGGFCHLAKNLYNHGNYLVRNRFIKNGQWMRYDELDKALKTDVDYPESINQFYNKKLACLKSVCQQMTGQYSSNRIRHFTAKRNRKIADYMHKASKLIVEKCTELEINTIVIGQNKEWKQDSQLSRRVNQHFVQLPFARLIQMIEYKARERGIAVILTEESYTSGTSFLDKEDPVRENYDKTRRIHRGLFRANNGRLINADVNGAFQIMRKVFPNVSADGIEGVVLRPVVVVAA